MLSSIASQHVQRLLNRGPMEDATHYGASGVPGDGPYVQIWLRIEDDHIEKAAFKTPGCPSSTAAGAVLCTIITGRVVANVASLTPHDLSVVVGPLHEAKGHYIDKAIEALQRALHGGTK